MCQIHVRGRKVLLACSAWSYYRGARGRAFPGLWVQCIPNVPKTYTDFVAVVW